VTPDDTQKGTLDALHRALFDSSPDMILLVQSNGEIHSRNEAAEGLGPARRLEDCFEAPDEIRKIQDRGFVASGEQELRLKDGRLVLLSVGALELYGRSAFQCILRDVTSYRLLAEELQLSRRMAAVGNLAAGVAHAMNNPLAVIMGRVELLQALGDGNKKDRERHLEVMADYARRMADIVQSLQIFSQPGLGSREEVAVQDVLKAAARACRERMGSVQIGIHVHPPGMVVPGDPVLLEQVFDGLLSWLANQAGRRAEISMVARSTGGNVVVLVGEARGGRDIASATPGGGAWQAADEVGRGLGFGVAVGAAILREHGGALYVPKVGEIGRLYRVVLPLAARQTESGDRDGAVGARQILVVEDDPGMRQLTIEMLGLSGHRVEAVGSAEEGLVKLSERSYDLVITDVHLPGLSGVAFREAAAARWPGMEKRVVLVTGLSIPAPPGVPLLRKPFSQARLLETIEAILDE